MDVVFFPTRLYSIIIGRFFSQRDCRVLLLDVHNANLQNCYWTVISQRYCRELIKWFFQLEYDYYNLTFFFSQRGYLELLIVMVLSFRDYTDILLDVFFLPQL